MQDLPTPTADTPTLEELRSAFSSLSDQARPRWGRMQSAQMVKHCRIFVELCLGKVAVGWPIRTLARLFGPMFLRRALGASPSEAPKNLKTLPVLRADDRDGLDLEVERGLLFDALLEVERLGPTHRHPLYGRMRKEDVIALIRHHTAHHANQFGLLGLEPSAARHFA